MKILTQNTLYPKNQKTPQYPLNYVNATNFTPCEEGNKEECENITEILRKKEEERSYIESN